MYPIERRNIALHIYSILNSLRKTAILCQVKSDQDGKYYLMFMKEGGGDLYDSVTHSTESLKI